jgi:hypothetical protein
MLLRLAPILSQGTNHARRGSYKRRGPSLANGPGLAAVSGQNGDKDFTGSMNNGPVCGGRMCPGGRKKGTQEIDRHWRASLRACPRSFHLLCSHALSAGHSYPQHLGWRSTHISARIQFARIAWHARWPPAAEHRPAGPGNLVVIVKAVCQPHSERRPRRIESVLT